MPPRSGSCSCPLGWVLSLRSGRGQERGRPSGVRRLERLGFTRDGGTRRFALDWNGGRHVLEDAHDGSDVHLKALSVIVSVPNRAWLRAPSHRGPAGWATVRSPTGSRATVGARVVEPGLSPHSPCTGRRNGPAGFVVYIIRRGCDTPINDRGLRPTVAGPYAAT